MKAINNELIRSFKPCYDPSEKNIPDDETLPVLEWVNKYSGIVPDWDIIWLLCRPEFMSEKDLRLFAVWCASEALKLLDNPDKRSINACTVAEKFALGEETDEDLAAAKAAAKAAAEEAEWASAREAADAAAWVVWAQVASRAAWASAEAAARAAALDAARAARASDAAVAALVAWVAARAYQLTKLLTYFK